MHSKLKGNIGEAAVVLALQKAGYKVFKELGDLSKIDLIAEKNGKLIRFQIKAVTPKNNQVSLSLRKSGPNYQFRYQEQDCDFFAVVNLLTLEVAIVNSKILRSHKTQLSLRLSEAKNNQIKGTWLFSSFTDIEKILRDYTRDTPPRSLEGDDIVQTATQG